MRGMPGMSTGKAERYLEAKGYGVRPSNLGRTVYYVDFTLGNDSYDGLSPETPWKTIEQVNEFTFGAGDNILFKRGETWTGTLLQVPSSHLRIADYGSGDRPIIDGNNAVDCVNLTGAHDLVLENLVAANGINFGYLGTGATTYGITFSNCDAYHAGNDELNFMGPAHDITILGGAFYNGYNRSGVGGLAAGMEFADGVYNVLVDGATIHDQTAEVPSGVGITIHTHSDEPDGMPWNITIQNCNIYANQHRGISISNAFTTAQGNRNIVIQRNKIYSPTTGTTYPVFVLGDGSPISGISFYQNEMEATYSECIYSRSVKDMNVYNNTFWNNNSAYGGCIKVDGAGCSNIRVKNNIMFGNNSGVYMIWLYGATGLTGFECDYNVYSYLGTANRWAGVATDNTWTQWQALGYDAHGVRGDPLFIDAANHIYTLGAESPAINAGVDVGLSFLGAAPDCGAHEKA